MARTDLELDPLVALLYSPADQLQRLLDRGLDGNGNPRRHPRFCAFRIRRRQLLRKRFSIALGSQVPGRHVKHALGEWVPAHEIHMRRQVARLAELNSEQSWREKVPSNVPGGNHRLVEVAWPRARRAFAPTHQSIGINRRDQAFPMGNNPGAERERNLHLQLILIKIDSFNFHGLETSSIIQRDCLNLLEKRSNGGRIMISRPAESRKAVIGRLMMSPMSPRVKKRD